MPILSASGALEPVPGAVDLHPTTVLVVGAGIVGLACGDALAKAGMRVTIVVGA